MSGFKVYSKRCPNCLFSDARIMSKERADDIIKSCILDKKYFICHKATLTGSEVCCKAFFDTVPTKTIGMAKWFGIVEFVELPNTEKIISHNEIENYENQNRSNRPQF